MTNIKKIALALVITLAVGYGVYASQQKSELSELALANVEALANGETGTSNTGPRERENAMEVGIKWYVVALILTHAKIAIASSTLLIKYYSETKISICFRVILHKLTDSTK